MDSQLVIQAQGGDRSAFGELAASFGDRLYAVAFRILRDADLAQDAAQEAIVSIWRDLRALREPDRFETWAYRILVRACYREARRGRTRGPHLYAVPDPSVEDHAMALANRDELERVFARLTPDQRAVVALQYYLGMSHPEIADVLDIPVGTVGSRLHAAKRALRAGLDADARTAKAGGRTA
ncbi:MAG: RNA polymerase sigma factor [Candidatus Limnocylindria bacterium]